MLQVLVNKVLQKPSNGNYLLLLVELLRLTKISDHILITQELNLKFNNWSLAQHLHVVFLKLR